MEYKNLKELIGQDSAARCSFRAYPAKTQAVLCEYAEEIHSTAQLYRLAAQIARLQEEKR